MLPRVIAIAAALFAATALAAPVRVVGFADMSCRAWIAGKDDAEQRAQHLAWVRGVLTGHNYAQQSRQVADVSSGTVENYVSRYCSLHPQGSFADAALRMSDEFSGRNAPIAK